MTSPSDQALIRVHAGSGSTPLTKAQKAFNRWLDRIEGQRQRLAEWQALSEAFQTRIAQEFEPLHRRYRAQQLALVLRLDRIHDSEELGKRERSRLAHVVLEEVVSLLEQGHEPELIALHDKYSDDRHEDLRREEAALVRAMVEDILGTSLDEDLQSPEAVLRAARQWLRDGSAPLDDSDDGAGDQWPDDAGPDGEKARPQGSQESLWSHDARDPQATAGAGFPGADAEPPGAERGEADFEGADAMPAGAREKAARARQAARARRDQALAEAATQSVRDAWRRLASALHPDREPDPVERERKTALMQRANQAYAARDLPQLLKLQLEAEQVGRSSLATASDAQLLHYNRVLKEQSERLDAQISAATAHFEMHLNSRPRAGWTPTSITAALNQDIAGLQREIRRLGDDLEAFGDIRYVKAWLKTVRIVRSERTLSAEVTDEIEAFLAEVMLTRAMEAPLDEEPDAPRRGRRSVRRR